MRRSKAPSVLKKAKICHNNKTKEENHCSDPEDEQYAWGSRNGKLKQNCYENKSIYNVVWRDVSVRKHKTWKGDGILEVNTTSLKAVLKDETGKYMGCSTKFKRSDLVPDFCMIIGGKEIEIQNELVDENQLHELGKRQMANCIWDAQGEEFSEDKCKELSKRKRTCLFKPLLVLNPPKIISNGKNLEEKNQNSEWVTDEFYTNIPQFQNQLHKNDSNLCSSVSKVSQTQNSINTRACTEFICFVRPSELQQFLFQKVLDYISSIESTVSLNKIKSLEIDHALQLICNHPSLINHKTTANTLVRHLIPSIPDWTEMGPFDSGKLEFVQYFLADITKHNPQVCTILAKNLNVINMLQGLCDFMDIKCLRLYTTDSSKGIGTEFITDFCLSKNNSTRVILINSEAVLNIFNLFTYCKKLIIFEEVSKISNICSPENDEGVTIYKLVTAFSIEEILLGDTDNTENMKNLLDELYNVTNTESDCCYLHSKIKCNCFETNDESQNLNIFQRQWIHFKSPFDMQLLKIASLENSSENIVSIFLKKKL